MLFHSFSQKHKNQGRYRQSQSIVYKILLDSVSKYPTSSPSSWLTDKESQIEGLTLKLKQFLKGCWIWIWDKGKGLGIKEKGIGNRKKG